MLRIKYLVIQPQPDPNKHSEVVFYEGEDVPSFMPSLTEPDHTAPLELWSPIAGDSGHVVFREGMVSWWRTDAATIGQLLKQVNGDMSLYDRICNGVSPKSSWLLVTEAFSYKRVPKTDSRYQKQLQATYDGEASE